MEIEDRQVEMDSPTTLTTTPGSATSLNEDHPRLKFLCSFNGSILPRPQDGKLRYVGGETRIVSVPRDIGFEELMGKMKELFEGASVLKYQQPDEDLDALVSVVNDDDVTNMMEEYEKLGSGDGFTRLRIFLFSSIEQDDSIHFVDMDERDNERRYVDALNSHNDSPDFGKQQMGDVQGLAPVDDLQLIEQYYNQLNLEGNIHSQRNFETPISPVNLRHVRIPHQHSLSQRYNEMESPWSPAYYSPRHHGNDFPNSPSSSRYHTPYGDPADKCFDRVPPDDYFRQQHVSHQPQYDQQSLLPENVVWLPPTPVSGDKAGFPGNILHGSSMFEGNNVSEHHCSPILRNETPDLTNIGNGFHQVANPSAECPPGRETYMSNPETKFPHSFYGREQNDPRSLYNEAHPHERGWMLHQSNQRVEEPRSHNPGGGRFSDHYVVDGNGMNINLGHTAYPDGNHAASHYVHHEDRPRYIRHRPEFGNEIFHDQAMATGSHVHTPHEECGAWHGNFPNTYGAENLYHASPHGNVPANAFWRNGQIPMHGHPPYEASGAPQQENGTCNLGHVRTTMESSPRLPVGVENQNPWVDSSPKVTGFNGGVPDHSYNHALKVMPNASNLEYQHHIPTEPVQLTLAPVQLTPEPVQFSPAPVQLTPEPVQLTPDPVPFTLEPIQVTPGLPNCPIPIDQVTKSDPAPTLVDNLLFSVNTLNTEAKNNSSSKKSLCKLEEKDGFGRENEANVEKSAKLSVSGREQMNNPISMVAHESIRSNCLPAKQIIGAENSHEDNGPVRKNKELEEPFESVKKAELEGAEELKAEAQEDAASAVMDEVKVKEETVQESDAVDAPVDLELDSDGDTQSNTKIEPTKAEEEAIARGLQTIKNDDLEEIRELGSGTYGAVYHGKWKGSDVAIKRIKASCFAGRPSERERLIADFWKEALILSSLHHPNVVSFYGIVRDGPDGSLATVTEFMVNGSLKQFLQKKDRTIDRRKRLIIAMDASFGMEYLHGKNIVHFDLKCENLLVNMRDPHRPICKIGDLGLSKVKQHTLVSGGVRGTLPWMAPELLSGKSHMVTEKIDVYSFGIVMWELLTGDEPYGDMHCASIIGGIVNNSLRPTIPTWCDPEWKALMGSCWSADPAERPSFSEISQKLRTMAAAINVK